MPEPPPQDPAPHRDVLRGLTDVCVHCGFCLPACPTYQLWGEEMDSPRGRIHLVRQHLDGGPLSDATRGHLDACLGCLACVPACPSGVRYDRIIEEARTLAEPGRAVGDRALRAALFAVLPYPRRLRLAAAPLRMLDPAGRLGRTRAGRWAAGAIQEAVRRPPSWITRSAAGRSPLGRTVLATMALSPPTRPRVRLPERIPARPGGRPGPARLTVGLLTGCAQSVFFSHVSAATARVLALEGCTVVVPRGQGCCGALAGHVGRRDQARRLARRTVATFIRAGVDMVVTDVAGCGSAMKEYSHLLADDPRWAGPARELAAKVRDVTELLAGLESMAVRHPVRRTVAYHDACHLAHGQGITRAPRELLGGIPGLRVVEILDQPGTCCGSAGVYNLFEPGAATDLGDRKAAAVLATGADLVAAGNAGCLLQIRAALSRIDADRQPGVVHPVELLDASLRGGFAG